jgi:hypothetical protein
MKLISFLHNAKNSRTVDEFDRPINGIGYQNFNRPAMSLSLKTPDSEDPKLRDYRASLSEADLSQIVNRIFNSIGCLTLGQISRGDFEDDATLRFYGRVAKSAGLPLRKFICRVDNKDYYTLATCKEHAEDQMRLLFKDRLKAVVYVEEFACD